MGDVEDPAAAVGHLSVSVANGARSVLRRRRVAFRHVRADEPEGAAAADTSTLLADEHCASMNKDSNTTEDRIRAAFAANGQTYTFPPAKNPIPLCA